MADSYRMARYKASLLPPKLRVVYTEEQAATLLMRAVTMEEIRQVARLLAMTFSEAYKRREQLYAEHYHVR
jgi:hypothetical protein